MNNIQILSATDYNRTLYTQQLSMLNSEAKEHDHTIIQRSHDFFEKIYVQSIIAVLKQQQSPDLLIGNCSIYDTEISPLRSQDGFEIAHKGIGEIGSVIVDKGFRGQHLGNKLLRETLKKYMSNYAAIISATVNPTFNHIAQHHGFMSLKKDFFPKKYFEQGEQYLAEALKQHGISFIDSARFLIQGSRENKRIILDYIQQKNGIQ